MLKLLLVGRSFSGVLGTMAQWKIIIILKCVIDRVNVLAVGRFIVGVEYLITGEA